MKRLMAAVLAFFVLTPLLSLARTPEMADAWNGDQINWRDIKSGIYESASTGRMAIMVFHAPWCSACKRYRSVFRDPRIVDASKKFVMILIDGDADKMTNGAFSPDGTYVPRTLFISPEGDVSETLVGKDNEYPHSLDVDSPDELLSLMLKAAASAPALAVPEPPATDQPT